MLFLQWAGSVCLDHWLALHEIVCSNTDIFIVHRNIGRNKLKIKIVYENVKFGIFVIVPPFSPFILLLSIISIIFSFPLLVRNFLLVFLPPFPTLSSIYCIYNLYPPTWFQSSAPGILGRGGGGGGVEEGRGKASALSSWNQR